MYEEPEGQQFTNKNYDWMQLGWLAVWVEYKHLGNYQQMKYESLPSNLKHVLSTTGIMESVLLVQDVATCIAAADAKEVTEPSATPWLQLTQGEKHEALTSTH